MGKEKKVRQKKHYPSSYSDTVSAASEEIHCQVLPELVDVPENIDAYKERLKEESLYE